MGKEDKMIQSQKEMSAQKVKYAKEIVDMMVAKNMPVTPYSVWKKSRLSKAFIYTNQEVIDYIALHRSEKKYNYSTYTDADTKLEYIKQLEKENAFLRKELSMYKQETLQSLMDENQFLKYKLEQYEKLVKDSIIQLPEDINV